MTERFMKRRYYKRKADKIRATRKVSFSKACERLSVAMEHLAKALS